MKIGTITFHFVPNQGAVLQCYALKRFLEKQGHEVEVIDYQPRYHTVRYSSYKNPFLYAAWFWKKTKAAKLRRAYITGRAFARCVIMNAKGSDKRTQNAFESFIKSNINTTKKYTSYKQLKNDPPIMDAYICGSDQLWNPELLDQDYDCAYFLSFAQSKCPKIAYAVSMGKVQNKQYLEKLKNLCSGLTAVSLREYETDSIKAIGRAVHICIDPSLLLNAADYAEAMSDIKENGEYIFVYGFETNQEIENAVQAAIRKYHCKVINGSPHRVKLMHESEAITDYGPDRFLSLISGAQCVVTNSFHATTFSIIYHKDFITVTHTTRGIRMKELLGRLELNNRLWGTDDFNLSDGVNWPAVDKAINEWRKTSEAFLLQALSGKKGEDIPFYPGELKSYGIKGNNQENLRAYYGYYRSDEMIRSVASGGVASAMAKQMLSTGGVVFGTVFTDDFKGAKYYIAHSESDIDRLKGTKYIPAEKKIDGKHVNELVKEELTAGNHVLFIGLPCDVGSLLFYLSKQGISTEDLVTVDLICHGPTFPRIHEAFVEELEKQYKSRVSSFNCRYVKNRWSMPYLRVDFENGKKYMRPLYETDYGFAVNYYARKSCYQCHFKGKNHAADITIGDFWGLKPADNEYNSGGVSALLVRTVKGDEFTKSLTDEAFYIQETDVNRILRNNPMYSVSTKMFPYWNQFQNDVLTYGLHEAVKHNPQRTVFRKAAIRRRLRVLRGKM